MKKAFVFPGQGAQFVGMARICMKTHPKQKNYLKKRTKYWDSALRI